MEYSFKINNRNWTIKELTQSEIRETIKKANELEKNDNTYYYGATIPKDQTILLERDLCQQQKRQTLMHELMHCYLSTFVFDIGTCDEECLCNISACSHDIIHDIVEKYFDIEEL